jgi:hypothetical protein
MSRIRCSTLRRQCHKQETVTFLVFFGALDANPATTHEHYFNALISNKYDQLASPLLSHPPWLPVELRMAHCLLCRKPVVKALAASVAVLDN